MHPAVPLRADVDADGTVDLLLLGSQPPRRLAITRVVFPPGGSLAAEFLSEGVAAADRVVYRALHDGDFDGDGQRDLVAVYQLESSRGPVRIELLLGLGAGRFDPARVTVLTGLRDVLTLVGDFDADGRSEVAFPRQRTIRVFGHDRATGWRELYQRTFPFNFDEAVVADLDRDGADDLAVWSRDVATALGALLGSPAAPLADWWLTWVGTIVSPLAALDRRSADPPTILVGIGSPEWNPQLLGLRWDPPSVGFVPAWIVPRPPDATYWTPLELDGDGREDVAFELISGSTPWGPDPQPGDRGRGYQLLLSRADGPPELGERSGGLPRLLDTRDLDGDGVLDALLLPESSVGLVRYRGLPGARFAEPKRFGEALGDWPTSFFRADLDRDGTLDLLSYRRWYGYDRPRFQSLLGRGDGTFDRFDPVELIDDVDYFTVRDLDGDGAVDFVIGPRDDPAGAYTAATNVYYGRGDGTFEPHVPLPHLTGGRMWSYVGRPFGDLDGDGDDDMLVKIPTWGWSDVMAWPYFVDGRSGHYGPHGLERAGNSGYVYRLLDVDGDGRDDPTYLRSSDAPGPASTALVWRRITQAGDFEAERVLLEWDPSALALTFAARAELDAAEAGSCPAACRSGTPRSARCWATSRETRTSTCSPTSAWAAGSGARSRSTPASCSRRTRRRPPSRFDSSP